MVWDEVNANNSMKWRWFIVPIKVEQINDYLLLDTYESKKKKQKQKQLAWMKWMWMIRHECEVKQQS